MGLEAVGYILLLGLMYGSMSVVSRFMLGQFGPISYTAVRLFLAGIVFTLFYVFQIRGRRWPKDKTLWRRSLLFGVIADAIPIILIISALRYLSSGLTTTLTTIFPVITVILAHFFLPDEPLTWRKGLGVTLGMSGAVLIVALGETGLDISGQNALPGYLMILASSLIFAGSTIYARKYMMDYDTFDTVSIRIISASAASILLAVFLEPNGIYTVNTLGTILVVYAAGVFFVGFQLGFYVLQRFGVTVSAMSNYLPPIGACIMGMAFLAEKITWGMMGGMGLILAGLAVINAGEKKGK